MHKRITWRLNICIFTIHYMVFMIWHLFLTRRNVFVFEVDYSSDQTTWTNGFDLDLKKRPLVSSLRAPHAGVLSVGWLVDCCTTIARAIWLTVDKQLASLSFNHARSMPVTFHIISWQISRRIGAVKQRTLFSDEEEHSFGYSNLPRYTSYHRRFKTRKFKGMHI